MANTDKKSKVEVVTGESKIDTKPSESITDTLKSESISEVIKSEPSITEDDEVDKRKKKSKSASKVVKSDSNVTDNEGDKKKKDSESTTESNTTKPDNKKDKSIKPKSGKSNNKPIMVYNNTPQDIDFSDIFPGFKIRSRSRVPKDNVPDEVKKSSMYRERLKSRDLSFVVFGNSTN